MHGSVPVKFGRLFANLLLHPQYISRCLAHNLLNGRTPLDLELPWFSYAAIDFLKEFLKPEMTVCEYGSGGSTLFFARRVKSVFSIEDNREWFERVTQRLRELQIKNVQVRLCTFNFKNPVGFEHSAYLHAMPDDHFDVIVIDGYQAKDGSRRANGRDITFEDGKKLFMGSSGTGAPYELNQKPEPVK